MWEDNWDIWSLLRYGPIEKPLRDETVLSKQSYRAWRVGFVWRFRMVDQLLSLNSRTCFGSPPLFSRTVSLTGTKPQIEGLVWLTAELMSKESPFEMMPIPGYTYICFMLKVMKISQSWWHVISHYSLFTGDEFHPLKRLKRFQVARMAGVAGLVSPLRTSVRGFRFKDIQWNVKTWDENESRNKYEIPW